MSWLTNVTKAAQEVSSARREADEIRNRAPEDVNAVDGPRSTDRQEAAHNGFWSAVAGKKGGQ